MMVIKKIGIFRALQLGDMLCSIPAIRALKSAYPESEIILIGLPWAKHLVGRFAEYFDGFIPFPGFPGLPEQPFDPEDFTRFLGRVQMEKFDLILQMQGNGSIVNSMIELFGARQTAGFYTEGHYYPDNGLFIEYPNYGHEINRHLALMNHLNVRSQGTELEFPLKTQDYVDLKNAELELTSGNYVCIHPGSRGAFRQWGPENFAALADYVIEKGFNALITGTKDEVELASKVAKLMNHVPVIAAGKTTLGAVGVLIKNAYALISNCTGVSHIASALKTPSIIISLDGEPERWEPLNKELHFLVDWTKTPDFNMVFEQTNRLLGKALSSSC